MTDTLVDSNVLLDVAEEDAEWAPWSEQRLMEAANEGALVINQVIYAELAAGYGSIEALDLAVAPDRYRRETIPWDAAFAAGHVFVVYRERGGRRTSPLPDFFIGAHAAVKGYRLLTRDRGYYRSYFPTLALISPESHP